MTKIGETEIPSGAGHQPAEVRGYDRAPTIIKRILVPTDLTKESDRAIEFGLILAKRFGAQLTLLTRISRALRDPICARPSRLRCRRRGTKVFRERSQIDWRRRKKAIRRLRHRVP